MSDTAKSEPPALPPGGRDSLYPESLCNPEAEFIRLRRTVANPPPQPAGSQGDDTVGLALSGGGIRSATFCLGVLQTMARAKLLRAVDYLSTVSGGGYIGGFLGALFMRKGLTEAEEALSDNQSREMRWLRENGRHLAPNGSGDLLIAMAVQFRNWILVVAIMSVSIVAVFLGMNWARAVLADWCQVDWLEKMAPTASEWLCGCFGLAAQEQVWWWSPGLLLALPPAVLAAACGWGYWFAIGRRTVAPGLAPHELTRAGMRAASVGVLAFLRRHLPKIATVLVIAGCVTFPWAGDSSMKRAVLVLRCIAVLGAMAFATHLVMWLRAWSSVGQMASGWDRAEVNRWLRNRYATGLKALLMTSAVLAAIALLDSLGQSLYRAWAEGGGFAGALKAVWGASGLALLFSLGDKLAKVAGKFLGERLARPSLQMITALLGVAVSALFLLNLNLLAHGIAWKFGKPIIVAEMDKGLLAYVGIGSALLAVLTGRHLPFLNGSSLQSLYGSRLVRAYLGASNPRRHEKGGFAVTETVQGDDEWLDTYKPYEKGAPLHLINVTFNETCSGRSQVEQRDRQGIPMAVGPAGISVSLTYHAPWKTDARTSRGQPLPLGVRVTTAQPDSGQPDFEMFPRRADRERPVENLSVGHWIAISGAAFGTGMGRLTSLGSSLLAGLANVRLGYWWDSHVKPWERRKREVSPGLGGWAGRAVTWLFPFQSHLLDEWLARFHGPARRHWYLSDGGHFENTGVYELLRRRVPHVICCDCGADPAYDFGDLANLVRKARIDYGAEIRFIAPSPLRSPRFPRKVPIPKAALSQFGLPVEFNQRQKEGGQPHAILAAVRFDQSQPGSGDYALILFLKPALSGDEPLDLWEYDAQRKDFPQESTGDQFFDEAQWESYRKLGEHTAEAVFAQTKNQPFWFTALDPETVWRHAS